MSKQKLLVLTGPTGVGKTKLAMWLYDNYNCRLISADSMQVYRGCDIATAKIDANLRDRYPHELIDIKNIDEEYSVAEFKLDALKIIEKAKENGELPILVGGTGLYIEGLLFPYNFQNSQKNSELREHYNQMALIQGKEAVYSELVKKNFELSKSVHPNNLKRVIRLLELAQSDNLSIERDKLEKNSIFDYQIIFLTRNREELYSIINDRVDEMIKLGLKSEAKYIFDNAKDSQVASAIGYKEFFDYFLGNQTLVETIDLIKQHSRNYAKRQITWFKRYKNILFAENDAKLLQYIYENYKEFKK